MKERLDVLLVNGGFASSREKAKVIIMSGKVFVNGQVITNVSRSLKDGEIISVRGIGKFKFEAAGGQTKKGRTVVTLLKYK